MNQCGKVVIAIALVAFLLLGYSPITDIAWSAVAPVVSNLPPVVQGISTPVRLVTDKLNGDIYVTDQRGGGILRFNSAGKLLNMFTAIKTGSGIAIDKSGSYLLVANGTSVAVLDKSSGTLVTQFGTFTQAHDIAVDAAGSIYVTDSLANNVQIFNSSFNPTGVFGSKGKLAGQFLRPTGIAFEKVSGLLAIADTLNGRIQFLSTAGAPQYSIPPDVGVITKTAAGIGAGPGRFTAAKGVAFEYTSDGAALNRIYVVDAFQSNIQVIDGATRAFLSTAGTIGAPYIGEFGFENGRLVVPFDVQFDNFNPLNPRLIVTNSNGFLTMYGCDSMEPTNITVLHPTQGGQLVLNWVNPPASSGYDHIRIYRSTVAGQIGTLLVDNVQTGVVPPAVSSYTDSNLAPLTTYYYTVHAVNGLGNETTGTNQVSETTIGNYQLKINISPIGTGTGSVTTNINFSCVTGTCATPVGAGTQVTMIPNPDSTSIFSGWSGTCNYLSGNCLQTMNSDMTVTATFSRQHPFNVLRLDGGTGFFDLLQDAYSATPDSAFKIRAMIGTVTAATPALTAADSGKTVTIIGGYDASYANSIGYTTIQGAVRLQQGKTIFNNIKIK